MKLSLAEANKTLALAGIFQAAHLVNQTAFDHRLNPQAYLTSIESIFKTTIKDVPSVFGNFNNVQLGLAYLVHYGKSEQPLLSEKIILRYILYMTKFAKNILADPKLFQHIQRRLTPIISQAEHLGPTHSIVIHELALLYRQVFLDRRLEIPVLGKLLSFKNTVVLNQIYALLIAGIRAAVLWYQVKGSRFQLLFSRSRLREQAIFLLKHEWPPLVSE